MNRTSTVSRLPGLVAVAVVVALTSYVSLVLVGIPREWQVTLCLVAVAVVGIVIGAFFRAIPWFSAAIVLALVSSIVFGIDTAAADSSRYWILALIMFVPGVLVLAVAATGISRAASG